MKTLPLRLLNDRKPQHPQQPVPETDTEVSRENVLPSSAERASQTRRFSSPFSPGTGACQATPTWPASSAYSEPAPSRPHAALRVDRRLRLNAPVGRAQELDLVGALVGARESADESDAERDQ